MGKIELFGNLKGSRVYFDVNPIIYFIEENTLFIEAVEPLFEMIGNGSILAFTSEFSLTEILVLPIRESLHEVVHAHKELLLDPELFTLTPMNREIFLKAAELAGKLRIRTPDALHLAAALEARCSFFITNDKGIRSIPGVTVVQVSELR
jgi:predicted nucleic acid-binding protein